MANVKAIIDVDINTSPAAAGLRSLQGQFNAFAQTLNTANGAHARFAKETSQQLSGLVNATQFFTAETVKMRTAASQLDLTLAKGSTTMGQFFSARFRKDGLAAAQVMSLANARASAMQTQFFATGQAANGMREAIAIRPLQAFNSAAVVSAQKLAIQRAMLNQATTSMINFGKNTQWAGRQLMVGFTVPLTIFAGVAGKAFRDLEKEAINFRKVYGDIFTTDVETEKALQGVRDLSSEFTKYGVAVQKTMQLAAIAAQAGQQGAQLMAATTQATRLAVLGDMENQDAMRTTIALQSAFKMSNEELAESINFLNMVENSSVLALQDVAEAIPRVAPVIQGLGGDVKDLSVMLVAMREGGVGATDAANGLKSSLGRLITPSRQAKDMATEFGINLERIVKKNAGDVLGTVVELATAMKSLGSMEQQQLLSTIFGKFQYARIGALFENITRDGSQAQRVMEMMAMSTEDMAKTAEQELSAIENSVATKFTAAIERMKMAIAPIGEIFVKMALPIVNFLAKIAESFNNLPDFAKNFIALGTVLVGLVIPAGTMFAGLLMNLIGTLVKVGHLIGLAFKGFLSGGISGAINNVSQALNYMSLEQIDATNSATQMAGATGAANEAFRQQIPAAAGARAAIDQLGLSLDIIYQRMMKVASANAAVFGPGAAAMRGAAGPARTRAAAQGITLTRLNKGGTAPGVGNKDTVPAMLTPGEFVINKKATQENLPLLYAINNGQNIPGFNKGGQILGMQYFNRLMPQRIVQPSLITTQDDLIARMRALQGAMPGAERATAASTSATIEARSLGSMPKRLVNSINNAVQRRIIEMPSKYRGQADTRFIRDLPLGVAAIDTKLNNDLRRGVGDIDTLISNYKRTGADNPLSPLFESDFVKKYFSAKGITSVGAEEKISKNLIKLLEKQKNRGLLKIGDAEYSKLSKIAFRASGLDMSDLYLQLQTQTGARRSSFETSVASHLRSQYSGKASKLISDSLNDAGIPFVTRKGKGRKWEYVVTDPQTGEKYLIRTSATSNIPGQESYQKLRNGPKGTQLAHFMKDGGQVPKIPGMNIGGSVLSKNASFVQALKKWEFSGTRSKTLAAGVKRGAMQVPRGTILERGTWTNKIPKPGEEIDFGTMSSWTVRGEKPVGAVVPHLQQHPTARKLNEISERIAIAEKTVARQSRLKDLEELGPNHWKNLWAKNYVHWPKGATKPMHGHEAAVLGERQAIEWSKKELRTLRAQKTRLEKQKPVVYELESQGKTKALRVDDFLSPDQKKFPNELEHIIPRGYGKVQRVYEENGVTRVVLSGDVLRRNMGGIIPGLQNFMIGGRVLSSAQQLAKIKKADWRMGQTQETSLADVLKMEFNDVRSSSPSSFLSSMFGRWEKNPARVSLLENTRMARKTGKLKRPMTPQDQYLADMIKTMDKFEGYAPDIFKPIAVGGSRVYDGHTRVHASVVKGLIEKTYGRKAGQMSNDELIDAIQNIRRQSLAGQINDDSILSVAQRQRILTQPASRGELERMSPRTHPLKRQHMQSMYNMEGRTLVPGVHDREIAELVAAGRSARFRGYGKTDDEALRALGFVRLGSAKSAGYFYNPTHDYGSRKGYVANTSSRIINRLVEEGKILPIQRNMGGIIPKYNVGGEIQAFANKPIFESQRKNYVPGAGNTDTVPAMLTPGEFVINKQATKQNLGLLRTINSGKTLGMNKGGKVPGMQYLQSGGKVQEIRERIRETMLLAKKNREMAKEAKILEKTVATRVKSLAIEQKAQKSSGMMGMGMGRMGASMGIGMGGMGLMMLGGRMEQEASMRGETSSMGSALSMGGIGAQMASILPFLPATILKPLLTIGAPIAAAGAGFYLLRKISDDIARNGQKLGSNMGGAANALNEISNLAGVSTPLQKAMKMQVGLTKEDESILQESSVIQTITSSESGQKFIQELSTLTSADRYEKLLSYLQYGIASEVFDLRTAQAFGKAISAEIGDPATGAAVAQRLSSQRSGVGGILDLATRRQQAIDPMINRQAEESIIGSADANKIIGGSLQVIQDFANAEALARQQFAEGTMSYEELNKVIQQSAEVQNKYTDSIQNSLEKTDALSSTLLGLKDSLIASGLTEAQESAIASAGRDVVAKITPSFTPSGPMGFGAAASPLGGPAGAERIAIGVKQAFSPGSSIGDVWNALTSGQATEVNEERTAQLVSLAQSQALSPEDIAAFGNILKENEEVSKEFDRLIKEGASVSTAAQGVVLSQKIKEGRFLGSTGKRFEEGERESLEALSKEKAISPRGAEQKSQASKILAEAEALEKKKIEIVAEISTKGIDPVAFEAYINSIPSFRQLEIAANISEMTPESAQRFLSDAQVLGSSVGNELGLAIQDSDAYKEALDEGKTVKLVDAFKKASEAGVSESVIKYAIRTEGASSPEDLEKKIKNLTASTKDIEALPDEMIKGLGIDLKNPKDIEKFGPIAKQLASNWPIIEKLNPNLDLTASMEFLTMQNGKPKSPIETANSVAKLNKAYRNLGSKDSSVRKQAMFEIATAYAGEQGKDFTPEQVAQSIETLRENFKNLDNMDPQIINQMLLIQIQTDVEGAERAARILKLTEDLNKTTDSEDKRRILAQLSSEQTEQKKASESALARQKALASTGSTSGTSGGSSGGGQKSITQQLQDEFKNLQSFFNSLRKYINSKTGDFQGVISGPFAPEFIEYLRSQGEEGLKVLKGSTDKLKKAYDAFIKVQQQQTANFIQTLPANFLAQARATQGETVLRNRLADQGVLGDAAETVVGGVDRATLSAYGAAVAKRQRNRQRKAGTRRGKKESLTSEEQRAFEDVQKLVTGSTGAASKQATFATASAGITTQNRELQQLSAFAAKGIPTTIAEQLMSMGIAAKDAGKPEFKNIVKGLEEIERKQSIQAIRQAFEDMGKDVQGTVKIMSAIPGISQEAIDAIKGLGADINKLSPDAIRNVNAGLIAMERAAEMAKTPIQKLTESLAAQVNLIQSEVEKINRLEIRPLELDISRLQKGMIPFEDEIKRIEKLIKPLTKDIEKLREEEDELNKFYEERAKVLDQVSRANEKIIAQQKGQLDIASALSRGDIAGAARATRNLQATMAQQRMDDAKAALEKDREDKRLKITTQIEEKEKEIKRLNELIVVEQEKIELKQESIEAIQRRIEESKERQLALEERIYKTQLLQNMLATKSAIQAAARAGRAGEVELLQGQLSTQQQIVNADPSFVQIPGFDAVMQEITPILTMNAQAIMNNSEIIGMSAAELSNKLFEAKEKLSPSVQELLGSWERDVTGAFINPETGAPFQIGELIDKMSEAGVNLSTFFVPESANLVDNMAKAGENTAIMARITDQIVEGFQTIRKRINEKIGEAYGAVNAINAAIQQSKNQAQRQGKNLGGTIQRKAFGGMISYKGSREPAPGMAMGGKMKKYASGAFVPGIGITDSVPAMLTPGEFVVRKSVAQAYGPMLQSLNSQIYPEFSNFAMGGFAKATGLLTKNASSNMFPKIQNPMSIKAFPSISSQGQNVSVSRSGMAPTPAGSNVEYNYSVNVNAETNASADAIANAVVYKFRRMEARQVKGTRIG